MLTIISRDWWIYVLRGILAIAFGLLTIIWPGLTIGVLVVLFGIYVIFEGFLALSAAFRHRQRPIWWVLLLEGLAGIVVGIFAFIWPGLTAVILLIFIAIWAILTGILEIAAAIQLRRQLKGGVGARPYRRFVHHDRSAPPVQPGRRRCGRGLADRHLCHPFRCAFDDSGLQGKKFQSPHAPWIRFIPSQTHDS